MATTLTLRQTKGSPLTFGEMDSNLQSLDVNKQENIPNLNVETSLDPSADKILFTTIPLHRQNQYCQKILAFLLKEL